MPCRRERSEENSAKVGKSPGDDPGQDKTVSEDECTNKCTAFFSTVSFIATKPAFSFLTNLALGNILATKNNEFIYIIYIYTHTPVVY